MKLKANEAATLANATAIKLQRERDAKAEKERKASVIREKKKRAAFREDLRNRFDSAIEWSVKTGSRSAQVVVVEAASDQVRAAALLDEHGYKDIIKAVVKEVETDGYKVETLMKTHTYRTSHESNVPDYDYYEYQKMFEVKW